MEVIKNECISKLEVVHILQKAYTAGRIQAKDGCASVLDDISAVKAVDVQPVKHGKWISLDNDTYFECSVCKNIEDIESNFCSRCGADMQCREWLKR